MRRHRVIRARNHVRHWLDMAIAALFAAWRAVLPERRKP